ncbi:unannotated protein [freshwater metagenome]|uniref:Unannotated protein n=1 Tax=freshwater metagenome TaxID=449393 RepID=A0A6J6AWH2_9ZZZZ
MSGLHFEHTVANFKHRNVEGSAAKVEDKNRLILIFFLHAIGKSCSSWLVDNTKDLKASNLTGLFRSRALSIIKIRRHRDDGLSHRVTKVGLCISLELHERASRDLL